MCFVKNKVSLQKEALEFMQSQKSIICFVYTI